MREIGGISLGGASKKAKSRQEVLQAAEAQRAARSEARRQQKAATVIQRAWRGLAARQHSKAAWLQEWIQQYSAAAGMAPGSNVLPADDVRRAVQLLLAALLPPPGSSPRCSIEAGGALALQQQPAQRRAVAALTALLSRSLKAEGAASNYLAPQPGMPGSALLSQAHRLSLLCSATVAGGDPPDLVLDAAIARMMELLLLPGSGGAAGVDDVRRALLLALAERPLPVLSAARRVALRAVQNSSGQEPVGASLPLPASINNTAGE